MRKHFLILMLMALLPFTAWAATVPATVTWSVGSNTLKYNGTERNLPTIDAVTEIDPFDAANIIDLKWYRVVGTTETEIAKVGNNYPFTKAGTYKVTFGYNGKSDTYTATWLVKKEDLDVIADNFNISDELDPKYATYHQITFGDEAPAYTWHFGDLPGAFDNEAKQAAEYATITGQEGVSFNCTYLKGSDVAEYDIIPVVSGEGRLVSENYNFVPKKGTLKVVPKALSKDATKYTITVTDKEYNASAREGGIAIKDLTFTGDDQDLTQGADFNVAFFVDATCTTTAFKYYTKADLTAINTTLYVKTPDTDVLSPAEAAVLSDVYRADYSTSTKVTAALQSAFNTLVDGLSDGPTAYSNHVNAGTYYMKVTGAGNYDESIIVPFKITQKPLAVNTLNNVATYSGEKQTLPYNKTTASFEGLENVDKIAEDGLTKGLPIATAFAEGVTMKVKTAKDVINVEGTASDYEIVAYAEKNSKTVNNLTQIFKNYQVAYFQGGKLTVNPKALTLTLIDQEVNFGDVSDLNPGKSYQPTADNAANYFTLTGFVNSEKIKTNPTLVVAAEEVAEGTGVYNITVDPSTLTYQSGDGKKPIAASNYTIAPAPTSTLTATLTINKGFISVRPNNAGNIYGDAEAELTVFVNAAKAEDKAKAEAVLKKAITIAELSSAADGYVTNNPYPGAGVYEMTLDFTKIKDEADFQYLTKYYNISKFTGTYTVTKRALTKIEIADQVLTIGDAATALDEDKVAFTAADYTLTSVDKVNLKGEFKYSAVETGTTTLDGEGVDHPRDIKIEFDGVTAFTNFSLPEDVANLATAVENKYIFGKLTVKAAIAGGIVLNPVKKAVWLAADNGERTAEEIAAIREAFGYTAIKAADQTKTDVKFGSFTMAPERWYTLVLPFNTTVAEVSKKLGYAVVNVLNKANDTEDVKFKLWMQEINANEPFLVKVYKEVNLADDNGDGTEDDPITFTDKTVEFAETPSVKDAANNEFIGTFKGYIGTVGTTDEYYMATSDGKWWNAGKAGSDGLGGYTRPSGAYLKIAAGSSARIFIEEPDGTTAIQTINADGELISAEGWYTLNGVKLQSVPTEKGVYIHNGKKIVVK